MLATFKFCSNEKHVREDLTAAFSKRGVDLRDLDPIIQSTMVAEALSTGAEEQVERFARVAQIAEQFDIPDDLKREMVIKAYASLLQRASRTRSGSTVANGLDGRPQRAKPNRLMAFLTSWGRKSEHTHKQVRSISGPPFQKHPRGTQPTPGGSRPGGGTPKASARSAP
jgi:hypothetical protein